MNVLLDTCTFLWMAADGPELSETARALLLDPENDLYLSVVSSWEVAVKNALGRLPLPDDAGRYISRIRRQLGVSVLELDEESALHLVKLPDLHRDPFDRMLVCQALVNGLTLLTPDRSISQYPVRSIW